MNRVVNTLPKHYSENAGAEMYGDITLDSQDTSLTVKEILLRFNWNAPMEVSAKQTDRFICVNLFINQKIWSYMA
jgi:hypothetical protein